jgi:hypothetical protein
MTLEAFREAGFAAISYIRADGAFETSVPFPILDGPAIETRWATKNESKHTE